MKICFWTRAGRPIRRSHVEYNRSTVLTTSTCSFGLKKNVSFFWLQIRMLKRQAMEAVEDMEEMRRTHKDNANVSMQLLKKVTISCSVYGTETTLPLQKMSCS